MKDVNKCLIIEIVMPIITNNTSSGHFMHIREYIYTNKLRMSNNSLHLCYMVPTFVTMY